MARPPNLRVSLRGVTPLFIGGGKHEPNPERPDRLFTPAELRPPSIKGLLRYWYRALAGAHRDREDLLFGSTRTGQSPCLLRVSAWKEDAARWEDRRYGQPPAQGGFRQGAGPEADNGIIYLGYSLTLGSNDRRAIPPEKSAFTLFVTPHPQHGRSLEVRQAWLAALWLLVHIGGVGSRSRRGLGSLRIEGWEGWPECEHLPLACRAGTPQEWRARMEAGLGTLPGTAAEILDDPVRAVIAPDKINTAQWLAVVRAAHELGLRTTSTIMYGHVERPESWARHLLGLRDLQAETGGFTEFVPLPFVHMEAPMYLRGLDAAGDRPWLRRAGPTYQFVVLARRQRRH